MKISKRILSVLLALVLVVGVLPVGAFAAETGGLTKLTLYVNNKMLPVDLSAETTEVTLNSTGTYVQMQAVYSDAAVKARVGTAETALTGSWDSVDIPTGQVQVQILVDDQVVHTIIVNNPVPELEENDALGVGYGGIKVNYGASFPYTEVPVYQATGDGQFTGETQQSNDHKFYGAVVPEGIAQFGFTVALDGANAKGRYSYDGGATWQNVTPWGASGIPVPGKVTIQIISEKEYASGAKGWDGKNVNAFTLWVRQQTADPEKPAAPRLDGFKFTGFDGFSGFDPDVTEYNVEVPSSASYNYICAIFQDGYTVTYTHDGGKDSGELTSGVERGKWINYRSYGTTDLVVTVSDGTQSTAYTFHITRPEPVREDNNALGTAYGGIKVNYGASYPYTEVSVYRASSDGTATENSEQDNAHKHYAAVLPEGVEKFGVAVTMDGQNAKGRYSYDDGTTWTNVSPWDASRISAPAKVTIQIISEKEYYSGAEGWDGKQTNDFTLWVKSAAAEVNPDQEAANAVMAQIDAIGTVTLDSKAAIDGARSAYDALTDAQKKLVTNYQTLVNAEAAYAALLEAEKPTLKGEGTEAAPFQIENAKDAETFSRMVAEGESFSGKYVKLINSIELPESWTPVGGQGKTFQGTFLGGGKQITVAPGSKTFFGSLSGGAVVKDLDIYGTKIAGAGVVDYYTTGQSYTLDNITLKSGTQTLMAGFVGGYGNESVFIKNSTVEAGVVIGYDGQQSKIGSFGGDFNGVIENCVSHGVVQGVDFVGGIVGCKGQTMRTFEIRNCTFDGQVKASGKYAGGIAGGGYGGTQWGIASAPNTPMVIITGCTVAGSISGKEAVGGILGAEPGLVQCWSNGTGYIQGNTFSGTVSGNSQVGAIVGYMHSLNQYTNISGNYYAAFCGTDKVIGGAWIVDTNCANPTPVAGVQYINTENGTGDCPKVQFCSWKAQHNRTDDPLGKDAEKLAQVLKAPVVLTSIAVTQVPSKTAYLVGEQLDLTGLVITAHWSDDTTTTVAQQDISVAGFDPQTVGEQTITVTYQGVSATFKVTVTKPETKITVSFTLLGDSKHGSGGTVHTYKDGNLTTWISRTSFKVSNNATVKDVLEMALTEKGYSWKNPSGNYVSEINGIGEFTNGANSGWMYTLNGSYPLLGVAEQHVNDGDVIVFHYTDDYTVEKHGFNPGGEDNKAVKEVEERIDAIGTVSYTNASKQKIDAARKAYDALSYNDKKLVANYATLQAAEKAYADLKAADDQKKAAAVDTLIGKIDSEITLDSETEIKEARSAYDKLTAEQKALVKNYKKLTDAETALANLKATEADQKKAQEVIDQIGKLGKITLESEDAVKAARDAYDKLTDVQKALVTNLSKLEAAEKELARLKELTSFLDIYKITGDYLEALGEPEVSSIGGEWMVIGLSRSDRKVSDSYYDKAVAYIKENIDENGRLHSAKSTDNSRIILALSAIGKDATDVGGYDLISGLSSMEFVQKQGTNGPIWALIALDSGNYPVPASGDVTRDGLIGVILDAQLADGGWALFGENADSDMTGMAMQALAPYYGSNPDVKAAIDKALVTLSQLQNSDGSYGSVDGASSESIAQIIVALTALGIDPDTDPRFIKDGNSALDALLSYYVDGGGFRHILSGSRDGMATEQGYYALTAYARFLDGKTALYNMTDALDKGGDVEAPTEPDVTLPPVTEPEEVTPAKGGFPWWIVIVVIVLAAGVAVVIVLKPKKLFHK